MNFRAVREIDIPNVKYDLDVLLTSQKVNGKKVRIFEPVKPAEPTFYEDFSISVIDDAGLIDKLAVQSPLAISVLSKQDAIYSSAQAIEQLGLQEQVELKKAEMQAALDAFDKQQQQQVEVPVVNNNN